MVPETLQKPTEAGPDKVHSVFGVSRSTVQFFIDHGTSNFTVKELAENAGVSERTFYRYFPRKADVLQPFLNRGMDYMCESVEKRPFDEPLVTSLIIAWSGSWVSDQSKDSRGLRRIIRADDSLRGVWLQVQSDYEQRWRPLIAARLGIDPDSARAHAAGAAIVAASRMASDTFSDLEDDELQENVFAHLLDLYGPILTNPEQ